MKNIFLDTNIIIDYFVRTDYMSILEQLMQLGSQKRCRFYISYLTVANFAYIMRKTQKETLHYMINNICSTFEIVKNSKEQILSALRLNPNDFEDSLQYQAALDAHCECIVTRNAKDFSFSRIPILSAEEIVAILRNL